MSTAGQKAVVVIHVHGHLVELCPMRDGGWQATVPDLPGCMSDGDTMVEAVANVAGAITSWLEMAEELRHQRGGNQR